MVQLSTRLAMIALGVNGDAPPLSEQPPLRDGIHLRWGAERAFGFPWYGYYLYRRDALDLERTCLAYAFRELPVNPPALSAIVGPDLISSNLPLLLTDDFDPADRYELDLGPFNDFARTFVRIDIHEPEVGTHLFGEIGFREDESRYCVDLTVVTDIPARGQVAVGDITIDIRPLLGGRVVRPRPGAAANPGKGIEIGSGTSIRLGKPSSSVSFDIELTGYSVTLVGRDEAGRSVAKQTTSAKQLTPVTVALTARRGEIAEVGFEIAPLNPAAPSGRVVLTQICRFGGGQAAVRVTARYQNILVGETIVSGRPGEVVPFDLRVAPFDVVELTPVSGAGLPAAALIELCYTPLLLTLGLNWEPLDRAPEPITLPVTHPDYPATGNQGVDLARAETEANGRLRYPTPATFDADTFAELHESLLQLVEGGPSTPMDDPSRGASIVAVPLLSAGAKLPTMTAQHPLDLVLLGALHPAMAQMLGLYWLDETAVPGVAYDYLIIADTVGTSGLDAHKALSSWLQDVPGFEGWVVSHVIAEPPTPLPAPSDPRAYALPGGTLPAAPGAEPPLIAIQGSAGLRWTLPAIQGALLTASPVLYHLWRDAQGNGANPVPSGSRGLWLTETAPALVAEPVLDPFHPIQWPADRPQKALYAIDNLTAEGWYGYQVSGVDLFGRFSPTGTARWFQWSPLPSPRPWYYQDPAAESLIHGSAVRILDKLAPPPAAAVEAVALDPRDPYLLVDAATDAWRASLPAAVRETLVGLRVLWRWTTTQILQAPDAVEFRIYWNPGIDPPTPDANRSTAWQQRIHVTPIGDGVASPDGNGLLFDVFLPQPAGAVFTGGIPLTPTLADPLVYAHVGVAAADGVPHTPDAPQWASGAWGGRPGNEGRLGGPAKVFRVLRDTPPAPVVPPDSERVFATPADYHARSYYTFRWTPTTGLQTHVFRALDESLFATDWALRPRSPLLATDPAAFPSEFVPARRQSIATELNALNAFPQTAEGKTQALATYRALSNDALRVLAGLPGNERAFLQITTVPLDPADPDLANRVGPDNPPTFPVNPGLRIYIDTLDGRSTNRYFYRALSVDAANNRGPLSVSGPPVWLPNVVPPHAPVPRKATGDEMLITLRWASNREPDLAEYRVYRADGEEHARDIRAMTLVHTAAVTETDPATRPAEVVFMDAPVAPLVTYWYRIVAVDDAGNVSTPSAPIAARAFRTVPPPAPDWASGGWNGAGAAVELAWTLAEAGLQAMVQRQRDGTTRWIAVSGWLPADSVAFMDTSADPAAGHYYRVLARDRTGSVAAAAPALFVPPAGP